MMVRISRWLVLALLLSGGAGTCLIGGVLSLSTPAQAQFWGGPRGGGFFGGLFGGGSPPPPPPRYYERQYDGGYERRPRERARPRYEQQQQDADFSRAPPPHPSEAKRDGNAPARTVVVMGDGMADWLAYGLEDAFSDSPEVAIVRKNKAYSGLLHYDAKSDLDWWHVARDILAQEKPSYVVMMLGVTDRQSIRERDLVKEADKEAKEQEEKRKAEEAKKPAESGNTPDEQAKSAAEKKTAEEDKPKPSAGGNLEFRSEQWEKVYTRRIDETIAALKSKGVPVFWVGLPAIRGTKSTADASYLNSLYRARAQRAGIVYIDVWDGFVDEDGRYTNYGPDYEGQQRKLRTPDGVFFTNAGARKLAHYVEREIRRYMANRVVSLPSQSAAPAAAPPPPDKPTERPVAGPVVPLAALPSDSDQLLGGKAGGRVHGDALANQVLVKGEPIRPQPGRADDFAWPGANQPSAAQPEPAKAPVARPAKSSEATKPATVASAPPPSAPAVPQPAPAAEPEQPTPAVALTNPPGEPGAAEPAPIKKPAQPKRAEAKPKPPKQTQTQRPPPSVRQQQQSRGSGNPFDFFGAFR